MSDSNSVLDKWTELKTLVESLEVDVRKNAAGNVSAGIRSRKGLRLLKAVCHSLVRLSLESSKAKKEASLKEEVKDVPA